MLTMKIRTKLAAAVASLGLCLGLAACDRSEERMERLQDIGQGVVDQLGGNGGPVDPRDMMREASVPERALSGKIMESSPVLPGASAPRKFVIGSIVAKPRDMPEPETAARAFEAPTISDYDDYVSGEDSDAMIVVPSEDQLQAMESAPTRALSSSAPQLKRAMSGRRTIAVNPKSRDLSRSGASVPREVLEDSKVQRQMRSERSLSVPDEAPVVSAPPPQAPQMAESIPLKSAERRLMMRQEAMTAQVTAESRTIETMQKYGLAANIQRSRSGQMVIEVGSRAMSPTQFTGEKQAVEWIATEDDVTCPENVTEQQLQENPLLATVCVIEDLEQSGQFEYVEKDYVFEHQFVRRPRNEGPTTASSITPNDPLWGLQWNFLAQGAGEGRSAGGAGFVDFWTSQATQGSDEVVVAVVDTGLDMDHPDIKDSPNLAQGWDMVSDVNMANDDDARDPDPNDPGDECPEEFVYENTYHGTHVAGTIGASVTNNANGVAGGAWNVKIVPVRALGKCGGRLSDINDAIRWAGGLIPEYDVEGNEVWNDNPADIINLSIGLFRYCPASMQDAINEVVERGVVVVAAAGNDKVSTQYYAPGGCNNVLSVAAGDARGIMAPYSNYGTEVDLMAPGGDLTRDDNGDGRPDGILSTKAAEDCVDPVTNESIDSCYYAYEQGTSMAAPHVSAALALVKSKRPDLSGNALSDVLLAALSPRSQEQCAGPCVQYPGAEPIEGSEDLCKRPCGSGLLNLTDINLDD